MRNVHRNLSTKPIRSGSALVLFLVFVGLVIAVILAQGVKKKAAKDPDTCFDLEPWTEWRLRKSNAKALEEPSKEQPDITDGVRYDPDVNYQDERRGEINLVIHPDGTVSGAWHGYYHKEPKLNFDIQGGDFEGYVCPLKLYQDENGEDPSKLYFIAKGSFLIHEYGSKNNKYHISMGNLYVTGWIEADYTGHGKLVITSDEKYSETYDWKAYRPIKK